MIPPKFFFATGMSLLSFNLAVIRGYADPQTHASSNFSVVAYISLLQELVCQALPSNDMRAAHYQAFPYQ
jgi:hypothetical protein